MNTTDERNIPENEINEAVAKTLGYRHSMGPWWTSADKTRIVHIVTWGPYKNHITFHKFMDPETQAKVRDKLNEWFRIDHYHTDGAYVVRKARVGKWWHHPDYKANERLWDLRALVAVLNGG